MFSQNQQTENHLGEKWPNSHCALSLVVEAGVWIQW